MRKSLRKGLVWGMGMEMILMIKTAMRFTLGEVPDVSRPSL